MKNNINNRQNNIFDHEFNLTVNEIINIIEKVYNLNPADGNIDPRDVEVALLNDDFYVRPGAKKDSFMNEWCNMRAEVKKTFGNIENQAYYVFIIESISIIKRYFDRTYFKEQIERRKHRSDDKTKLRTYIHKLDKIQLFNFMKILIHYRMKCGFFISETSSITLWRRIDEECRKGGLAVPEELDSYEGEAFLRKNEFYYFKVLSTKTIAALLYNAIDLDVNIVAAAAKKYYTSGYDAMINYINRKFMFCD